MDGKEELKQIYDIFADCWRLYKRLYPPSRPEDDTYWQGMMKELEVLRIKSRSSLNRKTGKALELILPVE